MPRIVIWLAALLIAVAGWYLAWNGMMAGDVARVKASIAYHDRAIKARTPSATLRADKVHATGFPFGFRVAVERPSLTQIWGQESYAVSLPHLELERVNSEEGRYRVRLPADFDAMYAQAGSAPEQYRIHLNEVPAVLLRAQADSRACPNLPGSPHCPTVAGDAPLVSFAVQLPKSLVLDVALNGKTRPIGFEFMPITIPVFMKIPDDAAQPLQLFVGMLREALVFQPSKI